MHIEYIATKPFSEELLDNNTVTPVKTDFIKAFQSVIYFYNAINSPKLHMKTESEISSNNARYSIINHVAIFIFDIQHYIQIKNIYLFSYFSDNNVLNNENGCSNSFENESVQNIKPDELNENQQVHSKVKECEAGTSDNKVPSILKMSSISHTIQRSRKKNKKTFNDLIS